MKKKLALLFLTTVTSISAVACGDSSNTSGTTGTLTATSAVGPTQGTMNTEITQAQTEAANDVYFKDNVIKTDEATFKIIKTEVVPPVDEWDNGKSKLVITYEFTNNTEDLTAPSLVWTVTVQATQETDVTVDNLDYATAPDSYQAEKDVSDTGVKPGATVQAVQAYYINDLSKPVALTATNGIIGEKLGSLEIQLQ